MKKMVSVTEVEGEGLVGLMGERVTLFCMNYFYTGKLTGVNETCVLLDDAKMIFETGAFTDAAWASAEAFSKPVYVQISAIEAFTILK